MNKACIKIWLIVILGLSALGSPLYSHAQWRTLLYADVGKTNVSEGMFVKTAALGAYDFGKNSLGAGTSTRLVNRTNQQAMDALVHYSRFFEWNSRSYELNGFIFYNRFSSLLYENNLGLFLAAERAKFYYRIGLNFKTYGLTNKAQNLYEVENSGKLSENFNPVYSVGYSLWPRESDWNASVTMGNIDYFLISQPTNPLFHIKISYRFKPGFIVFLDSFYKSSGAFNLSVNSFGYHIRTGVLWKSKE